MSTKFYWVILTLLLAGVFNAGFVTGFNRADNFPRPPEIRSPRDAAIRTFISNWDLNTGDADVAPLAILTGAASGRLVELNGIQNAGGRLVLVTGSGTFKEIARFEIPKGATVLLDGYRPPAVETLEK